MHISPISLFNTPKINFQSAKNTTVKAPKINDSNSTMDALQAQGIINMQQIKSTAKKNEPEKTIKEAEEFFKSVNQDAKKIDAITSEAIYNMLKKHQQLGYYKQSCEELTPNGEIFRKVTLNKSGNSIIEELPQGQNGPVNLTFFENGHPYIYIEGYRETQEGDIVYSKYCLFENGDISLYQEGFEKNADGTIKCDISIEYQDGEPVYCQQNAQELPDGSEKCAKILSLWQDETYWCQEGYEKNTKGAKKIAAAMEITNGIPIWYEKNARESASGNSYRVGRSVDYEDGKPIRIEINNLRNSKLNKIYEPSQNGWEEITE